ncbi:verrucotoxin subunit beta-like [Xenia sp. Carnegie-2017]|uniref:verrucotoxin subunit beta-like n=1 Tax=Xenia sp. Carnegie-2017 TaxID=2897299 RepID=UPI001F03508B|nr:verrucotoxin subunit beta-like [Xenia sp. Carnegie-2017]
MAKNEIPALGRPFQLGMLYDRRSEKLVMGRTLWSHKHLNESLSIHPKPYTNNDVFVENSIDDKTSALNIEAGLKLSFLTGLVNVEGSAKYLSDAKTSKRYSRVVLHYETTTEVKQLTMEHLGKDQTDYHNVFNTVDATDVVVGIVYGAKAFFVFENEVSEDESVKEVSGKMKVLVQSLPGVGIGGHGMVDITKEEKKYKESMRCKMYGDFRLNKSPTNFEEAIKVYKELPSLIGEKGENAVPIQVYLYPLSKIDKGFKKIASGISANLITQTSELLKNFIFLKEECNDLLHNNICCSFPQLKKQINKFLGNVEHYRSTFEEELLSLLPKVRGDSKKMQELASLIKEKEESPFSCQSLKAWLEDRKNEVKRFQNILDMFEETSYGSLENINDLLIDPTVKYIVSFTLKTSWVEDHQLRSMDAYQSKNYTLMENDNVKIGQICVPKKIRDAIQIFKNLKSFNEKNDDIKFLVIEESLHLRGHGKSGAFVSLYVNGELVNNNLSSGSKPKNLEVLETSQNSLNITWDEEKTNIEFAKSYKIFYTDDKNLDTWPHIEQEWNGTNKPTVVLSNLEPATTYHIKVCALNKIPISECSEVLSVTTSLHRLEYDRILRFCKLLKPSENRAPAVYGLPLSLVSQDQDQMIRKFEVNLNNEESLSNNASKPHKAILMVSFEANLRRRVDFANAMVNYIFGIQFEENFRLQLIYNESQDRKDDEVFVYTLHHMEGFKVPFNITIIDFVIREVCVPTSVKTVIEEFQRSMGHLYAGFHFIGDVIRMRDSIDMIHKIDILSQFYEEIDTHPTDFYAEVEDYQKGTMFSIFNKSVFMLDSNDSVGECPEFDSFVNSNERNEGEGISEFSENELNRNISIDTKENTFDLGTVVGLNLSISEKRRLLKMNPCKPS